MTSIVVLRSTRDRSIPSSTPAQRRLLVGLIAVLAIHVMASVLYVIGG